MPFWLEIISRLGPLFVSSGSLVIAYAVFSSSRSQSRWNEGVALRSAMVEDQKLRLSLLDRRMVALERVRSASSALWTEGEIRQETSAALEEALRIAELVFDDTERQAIDDMLRISREWQWLQRRIDSYQRFGHREELQEAIEEQNKVEQKVLDSSQGLVKQLIDASRVSQVPPLAARSS